jgi:uncharacterized protein YkuJ
MKIIVKKYTENVAGLILIAYLSVLLLSILHYHQYDLLGPQSVKKQKQTETSKLFFNDELRVVCTVQLSYTKLNSINFSDLSHKSSSGDFQDLNYISSEIFHLLSTNKLSHNLRAPPSL